MSGGWKQKERLVADWFSTRRNPLSGRNNVGDDLNPRLGDVIYRHAVIEVKRRKSLGMELAKETRLLARKHGKPWVHIEFQTGCADMVKITVDYKVAKAMFQHLDSLFRADDTINH